MKKIVLALAAAAVIGMFVSCDTKVCACYEYTSTLPGATEYKYNIAEFDIRTEYDKPCESLNRSERGEVGHRVCVEDCDRYDSVQIDRLRRDLDAGNPDTVSYDNDTNNTTAKNFF
ncbi:MAG: hypothetical protein IJU81_07345 [Bacteroidales bacterium]|nr:hypothetical protein [Bacteroidales bacterium]